MRTFQVTSPNGEKYIRKIPVEELDYVLQYWDFWHFEYIVLNISDLSPQPSSCS